jgi:hypothetical protein
MSDIGVFFINLFTICCLDKKDMKVLVVKIIIGGYKYVMRQKMSQNMGLNKVEGKNLQKENSDRIVAEV